jgi:energy-coupling factor transporter ATP-binding protein EcfA2
MDFGYGRLRGLKEVRLNFQYPITAISGKNGTGKSTAIACAACAYHSTDREFNPFSRRAAYYTDSDFFVQSAEEIHPSGIWIAYQFLHDNWRPTDEIPTGTGLSWQIREKLPLGRWTNYKSRVTRDVVFLGLERVVPHSEKTVSKAYRRVFQKADEEGYENEVKAIVGRILGRSYDQFYYKRHTKYRLPLVTIKKDVYSGFNMGAGENALFEIFSIIHACPDSLLLVIDEIELSLHEEAQIALIRELKELCLKRKLQIICTTHSARILECLPPEGRIHLSKEGSRVVVMPGISPRYAAGLLSGEKQAEVDVYCEDGISEHLIAAALPNQIRSRVRILPIGSSTAVIRHLAARYKDPGKREVCAILDGDKRLEKSQQVDLFTKTLESVKDPDSARLWVQNRIEYLPGTVWPEKWIPAQHAANPSDVVASSLGVAVEELREHLGSAQRASKHQEFTVFGNKLNLKHDVCAAHLIRFALDQNPNESPRIVAHVSGLLQ